MAIASTIECDRVNSRDHGAAHEPNRPFTKLTKSRCESHAGAFTIEHARGTIGRQRQPRRATRQRTEHVGKAATILVGQIGPRT